MIIDHPCPCRPDFWVCSVRELHRGEWMWLHAASAWLKKSAFFQKSASVWFIQKFLIKIVNKYLMIIIIKILVGHDPITDYQKKITCGRIVCRRLVYLDCNCEGGVLLWGRWQPPDHHRHDFHCIEYHLWNRHHHHASCNCDFITCLPSTVRPRVLCINLLKVKGEKLLCQAQCASPLV